MEISLKSQIYIFITSIYGGLVWGLLYDLYRVIRCYLKPKGISNALEDLLFWMGMSVLFFYIVYKSNWGQLRAYIFLGFSLGGIIYLKILSRVVFTILMKIFRGLGLVIKNIFKLLKGPFVLIKRLIGPKISRAKKIIRIPRYAIKEIKRYRKIISKKK